MKTKTYYKKKELKRKNCKKFTPLYYTKFHGVKSVYNKKIRRFFRNRYKDILTYYMPFFSSIRGLRVKFFLAELRKYAQKHEYD